MTEAVREAAHDELGTAGKEKGDGVGLEEPAIPKHSCRNDSNAELNRSNPPVSIASNMHDCKNTLWITSVAG